MAIFKVEQSDLLDKFQSEGTPILSGSKELTLLERLEEEGVNVKIEEITDILTIEMPWCNSHNCSHACSACNKCKSNNTEQYWDQTSIAA